MTEHKLSTLYTLILAVCVLLVMGGSGYAQIPLTMNYQGFLTDTLSGDPIDDPALQMTFALYDAPTGGESLWSETQTVDVNQGVYNVVLGSVNSLSLDFYSQYYLEIIIGTETLDPRLPLSSAGYAIRSDMSDYAFDIGDNTVTTSKIVDSAVTSAKIAGPIDASKIGAHSHSGADITSAGLDADTVDGMEASAFGSAIQVATNVSDISSIQSLINILFDQVGLLQTSVSALTSSNASLQNDVDTLQTDVATLQGEVSTLTADNAALTARVSALEDKLAYVNVAGTEMYITGANLHILNGAGSTESTNSLGNLIMGYGEGSNITTGSHNIVLGRSNNYSSYAGIVAGYANTISAPYASVLGGRYSSASGDYAAVSGGFANIASGDNSSVSGGSGNTAGGISASVSGGSVNQASGDNSSISGGQQGAASLSHASISGGFLNNASGSHSSVIGGFFNDASGYASSVSGGNYNIASGASASVSGGDQNTSFGVNASVSGGQANHADGNWSSISGGTGIAISGDHDWQAGSLFEAGP
jgi:FtsZ-binding cell division protein ZapB